MMGELGKSQLSSLLETVPGLASVLRSPVADAIVNMVRAGAGLRDFDIREAEELVQYATRRGLIPSAEGAELLDEIKVETRKSRTGSKGAKKPKAKKAAAKKAVKKQASKKPASGKKSAKKTAKVTKKTAKKSAKKKTVKTTARKASKGQR